ncbi:MAG: flippase-like domain-containing protein [Candidatus Omnitrophica bacterium]|nr:flippase-like domain-containing protein [Candidatus Omnitrophota bacterium]
MINRHKRYISYLLLVLIVCVFVFYMRDKRESLELLRKLRFTDILILVACSLFFKSVMGLVYRVLMILFDIKLIFKEWFGLVSISMMVNYFLPFKGGLATVAVYLKKIHGFRYTSFLSSVTGLHIIGFLINGIAGMLLMLVIFAGSLFQHAAMFMLFLSVTVVTAIIFISMYYFPNVALKWNFLKNFLEGFENFHKKPRLLIRLIILQLLLNFAAGMRLWIAYKVLGISMGIIPAMIVMLIASFSQLISITPAGLGIKEFFITASSAAFGIDPASSVMAALLDRSIDMINSFILGFIFTYIFTKKGFHLKEVVAEEA